jgi:hypothetical protein
MLRIRTIVPIENKTYIKSLVHHTFTTCSNVLCDVILLKHKEATQDACGIIIP